MHRPWLRARPQRVLPRPRTTGSAHPTTGQSSTCLHPCSPANERRGTSRRGDRRDRYRPASGARPRKHRAAPHTRAAYRSPGAAQRFPRRCQPERCAILLWPVSTRSHCLAVRTGEEAPAPPPQRLLRAPLRGAQRMFVMMATREARPVCAKRTL
eukprot:scaffold4882_cov70-Phaeocystis_antarctica.AAC.16